MRFRVAVSFVVFLLLAQPMLVMRTVHAQTSPVYFSVEPIAVAPLTDINVSINGLETPAAPSPVGQFFTVELHLRGATQTNVPAGVAGVEVHFYFGNILSYAVPTDFTDMIGQTGGVFSGALALYGINAGFYDSNNNPIESAPYTGAVYYEVAAATHTIWNEADGIVAKITFKITNQPQSSQGEQTLSFPLTLVEIGPGLEDGNVVTIPHDIVQGTLKIDASTPALPLAADYLVRNYNATVGLIPEAPGSNTYWLYSDNFLASYALWRYDPSNLTLANIATNISNTISTYVLPLANPLNQYMVLNSSIAAFNDSSDYTIAHYGDAVISITLNNGTGALNPSDFADIAFLEALYYHGIGQVQNAYDAYQNGTSMLDGKGLNDSVFQNGAQKGQYQTFKLALYVYVSKVLGQQFSLNAETTLLKMQADSGGFYTGYDENYSTNGTNTNVETTSLAILAFLEPSGGTIYIRADGSIDPPTAPIFSADNITYTLTGNITVDADGIVIERDNIALNGAGYTVTGSGSGNGTTLKNRSNVTVGNMTITNFLYGIELSYSSDNILSGNNAANNYDGIDLYSSSGNTLSGNNLTANGEDGIGLLSSSGNTLSGNNVTANNGIGIGLSSSSDNSVLHNSFVDNTRQVAAIGSKDTWDDGFPSGGNNWSDYNGSDSNHDGIGDMNYTISAINVDRYPLMGTFNSFSASSEQSVETICNSTISGFTFNGTAISFNVSGDPGTTGFCRICIPTALMNDSYNIFVNGTAIAYTLLPFPNNTQKYLYFNYTHSTQQVTVTPEASTLTILLLLTALSSLTILSVKKRTRKRLTQPAHEHAKVITP